MTEQEFLTIVVASDVDPVALDFARESLEADGKPYSIGDLIEMAQAIEEASW